MNQSGIKQKVIQEITELTVSGGNIPRFALDVEEEAA